ncbi:hypothetical protein IQ247_22990 [Plectonema cf. radiosum LEGE 06105]|uniref:Uncharacterized protein n=1 Tax=Plectonema cf. radiosum LEGE 06105 TaxID=945769 RepID=A0A8J7F7G3_9CYAN|nr:hypothetical protein [Plectonema radiosum]MBE9215495.1 hypothetical protein [Plectonema cf. radiosum LEGE 06105]
MIDFFELNGRPILLQVKDIDFAQNQITVRDTKGNESRATAKLSGRR